MSHHSNTLVRTYITNSHRQAALDNWHAVCKSIGMPQRCAIIGREENEENLAMRTARNRKVSLLLVSILALIAIGVVLWQYEYIAPVTSPIQTVVTNPSNAPSSSMPTFVTSATARHDGDTDSNTYSTPASHERFTLKEKHTHGDMLAEIDQLLVKARARWDQLAHQGLALTPEAAKDLETMLASNPNSVAPRIQLLGYYLRNPEGSGHWDRRNAHLLWLFSNQPELPFAGAAWASLVEGDDPEAYAQARDIWNAHLRVRSANPYILLNAASFFGPNDPVLAQDLVAQARTAI